MSAKKVVFIIVAHSGYMLIFMLYILNLDLALKVNFNVHL